MKNYKLAVIIPSWNCQEYLAEMLDSILAQSFQDWRVFVVDDQSTDSSLEIIKDYAKNDQRISYLVRNREPKGAQTCRNLGFEQIEGAKYVIWFDADDVIAPYCFEQRVSYMDRHPELDFGIFPAITFQDKPWEEKAWCYGFPLGEDDLSAMLLGTLPMVGWTNIYRKKSLIRVKHSWDEHILSMQDFDFNVQGLLLNLRYDYAVKEKARVDYFYRTKSNTQKISHKICTIEHFQSHIYLLQKTINGLDVEKIMKYQNAIEVFFFRFASMFTKRSDIYNQLFRIPWVKDNVVYYLRLKLWEMCGFRLGGRLFFKTIVSRDNLIQKKWHNLVEREYVEFCKVK